MISDSHTSRNAKTLNSLGLERAERGACPSDGVVRRDVDDPVVRDRRSCRGARASGSGLVSSQGDSHVHGYAGRVTVADVAVRGFWPIWNRDTLARSQSAPPAEPVV